jgi:cytochrome c peroxidase
MSSEALAVRGARGANGRARAPRGVSLAVLCIAAGAGAVGCAGGSRKLAAVVADSGSRALDAAADGPGPAVTDEARKAFASLSLQGPAAPPVDASNRWADDARAALLGRRLFFDASFSGRLLDGDNDGSTHALGRKGDTGKVACAGCHLPASWFADTRTVRQQTSLGAGWGLRRAPSLLDVGRSRVLMWDGRRDAMYNQVFGPIESEVEMNSSRLFVAEQVFAQHRAEYEAIFGALPPLSDPARFPPLSATQTGCGQLDPKNKCAARPHGVPGDGAEFDGMAAGDQEAVTRVVVNVGKAIGAYERLLTCGPGRFDRWVQGDSAALTPAEQRGAALFVGRGRCSTCHSGPFLSDEKFHVVGLKPATVATVFIDLNDEGASKGLALALADPLNVKGSFSDGDDGRLPGAVDAAMTGAFRTPRLRCISKRPSFMHTGQFRTLDEVVAFLARGGDPYGYLGKNELAPVDLTPGERSDLVQFLLSLDGSGPSPELLGPP